MLYRSLDNRTLVCIEIIKKVFSHVNKKYSDMIMEGSPEFHFQYLININNFTNNLQIILVILSI